jgi:hypothetical protein
LDVVLFGEIRNPHKSLAGKPERKDHLEDIRRRLGATIEVHLKRQIIRMWAGFFRPGIGIRGGTL